MKPGRLRTAAAGPQPAAGEAKPGCARSEFGLLALEIAWLRAAELPKVVRVEELLGDAAKAAAASRPAVDVRDSYRPPAREMSVSEPEPRTAPGEPPPARKALFREVFRPAPRCASCRYRSCGSRARSSTPCSIRSAAGAARRATAARPARRRRRPARRRQLAFDPPDLQNQPAVRTVLQLYGGRILKVRAENDDEETT